MRNWIKQKIADTQFWWATQTIKEGRDFAPAVADESQWLVPEPALVILRGKFKGVKFVFFNIHLRNESESLLEFQTRVVYNPRNVDIFSREFEKLTSNILRIILQASVRWSAKEIDQEIENENRTADTVESDEERGFHEEVTPLLEKRISERKSRKKAVPRDSGVYSKVQSVTKSKRNKTRTSGKDESHGK